MTKTTSPLTFTRPNLREWLLKNASLEFCRPIAMLSCDCPLARFLTAVSGKKAFVSSGRYAFQPGMETDYKLPRWAYDFYCKIDMQFQGRQVTGAQALVVLDSLE